MVTETARPSSATALFVLPVALLCLAALALLWVPPAEAAFPGANGKLAYVSDSASDRLNSGISAINPDGSEQTLLAHNPMDYLPGVADPVWSPDGRKLAFAAASHYGDTGVYIISAAGDILVRLHTEPDDLFPRDGNPSWSPGGDRIAFTHGKAIWAADADGSDPTDLTGDRGESNGDPTWSPDGAQIAFTSSRDGNPEIYVMNADGSEETRLTDDPGADSGPAWSPDGERIAFTSSRDGNDEIYSMNADGSEETRLTDNPGADGGPAWSPDGERIAFTAEVANLSFAVYVMNADGEAKTNLTANLAQAFFPIWSPDGRQIAFTSQVTGQAAIYVMNADGGCQTKLATGAQPDWQALAGAGLPPPSCAPASESQPAPASPTPPPPTGRFGFGELTKNEHKGTARLTVVVPGPGAVVLRGKKLKRASKEPAAAGEVRLAVKPKGKAKRRLSRHRLKASGKTTLKVNVRARVTFTPAGGMPNTLTRKLKLIRRR